MTDSPAISPLVERLAIARLAAPGCVSSDQLQRSHERFSNPPGARVSDRLFRRMEVSRPGALGLVLARTDPSLEAGAISTTTTDVATPVAGAYNANRPAVPAHAALATASPLVSNRLSRQSAGVIQTGTFAARKVAARPAVIASDRVVQRLVERAGDRSPPVFAATARSMSEQTFDDRSSADVRTSRAPRAADSITLPPANPPMLMRKAAPAVMTATTGHTPAADIVSHAPTNNLVEARSPVIAQQAMVRTLHRSAEETIVRGFEQRPRNTAAAGALALTGKRTAPVTEGAATAPIIGATAINASAPLVLRKAEVARAPSVPSTQLPTISTSAPGVISREVVATPGSVPNENVSEQAGPSPSGVAIDRIVEQVEIRLARRFEIERERQGVWPWRLEN